MKPIHEYLTLPIEEFAADLRALPTKEDRRDAVVAFDQVKLIHRVRQRIEKFLTTRGSVTREQFRKGLNIRQGRLNATTADTALEQLVADRLVKIGTGDSSPNGGRRGVVITWVGTSVEKPVMTEERYQEIIRRCPPPTADELTVIPGAIIEEVESNPSSQKLVDVPKTITIQSVLDTVNSFTDIQPIVPAGTPEPDIKIANEVIAQMLNTPFNAPVGITPSGSPKISLDNDSKKCEDEQVAEFRKIELPKTASVEKAQKIKRSALLEGLGS